VVGIKTVYSAAHVDVCYQKMLISIEHHWIIYTYNMPSPHFPSILSLLYFQTALSEHSSI
jgi:hypothetical protein